MMDIQSGKQQYGGKMDRHTLKTEKATFTEKLGYGIAALGDAISYGFVGTFFLFFLTTVADISPAISGGIVAIGSVWNALFNPLIGFWADKVNTRFGRRRPLILFFSVFLAISLFLMFTDIDIPLSAKPIYYGFMMIIFWSSFTGFFVPYCALGVDYASDYDERTSIRSFASFFNMVGNLFCMVMPTLIVDFLESKGLSTSGAWSATGGLLSIITFITIAVTVAVSKKRDMPMEIKEKPPRQKHIILSIFKEYISIAKLKPVKYLVAASLFSLITYTMIMSDLIYYLTYNKELSAVGISLCLFTRSALGILSIPIVGSVSKKTDKRIALIGCYIFGTAGMVMVRLTDIPGLSGILIYMFFVTVCTAIYWQIMPSIFYDICEYDEKTTGKKREATILSFQGLVEAVAVGIGGQILGAILQIAGFDGDSSVQTSTAMVWIENSTTVIPAVFILAAVWALYKYPLRRESNSNINQHH